MSPRRKNFHDALANVHEWSPSLLSPSFVEREQVARRFVEFVEFEYYCARASEIRWFKIYGNCKIQPNKTHTHAQRNEVTLVWGSLRLAPITSLNTAHVTLNESDASESITWLSIKSLIAHLSVHYLDNAHFSKMNGYFGSVSVYNKILHVKCRDTLVADITANTWMDLIIATIQTTSDEQQTRTTEILCLNSTIDVLPLVVYVDTSLQCITGFSVLRQSS